MVGCIESGTVLSYKGHIHNIGITFFCGLRTVHISWKFWNTIWAVYAVMPWSINCLNRLSIFVSRICRCQLEVILIYTFSLLYVYIVFASWKGTSATKLTWSHQIGVEKGHCNNSTPTISKSIASPFAISSISWNVFSLLSVFLFFSFLFSFCSAKDPASSSSHVSCDIFANSIELFNKNKILDNLNAKKLDLGQFLRYYFGVEKR